MPNAKVLAEKQAIVAELTEKIQKATAGVIVDYKGITVAEDTALRKECRESNVDYAVVKNTLLRFAFNNTGLNDLDGLLNGTTSLALSEDAVAPARIMAEVAMEFVPTAIIRASTSRFRRASMRAFPKPPPWPSITNTVFIFSLPLPLISLPTPDFAAFRNLRSGFFHQTI